MNFFELLNISPGVTAVIGSGGKTSLLRRLAAEAPGTVLLCLSLIHISEPTRLS